MSVENLPCKYSPTLFFQRDNTNSLKFLRVKRRSLTSTKPPKNNNHSGWSAWVSRPNQFKECTWCKNPNNAPSVRSEVAAGQWAQHVSTERMFESPRPSEIMKAEMERDWEWQEVGGCCRGKGETDRHQRVEKATQGRDACMIKKIRGKESHHTRQKKIWEWCVRGKIWCYVTWRVSQGVKELWIPSMTSNALLYDLFFPHRLP